MKKIILFALLLASMAANAQSPHLIPQPVHMQTQPGVFRLTSGSRIAYNKAEAQAAAQTLSSRLAGAAGYNLPIGVKGDIHLNLVASLPGINSPEGYTLSVRKGTVEISATGAAGLYYGIQTFMQLLPAEIESHRPVQTEWSIQGIDITDYPRFGWRGLMLDVSRHFMSKDDVKLYIDRMAQYKFNVFHWHLTDDNGWRVEIKSLPKLTQVGGCRVRRYGKFGDYAKPKPGEPATDCGFYTQEDVKEIIQYAAARHVTIVPEVDLPGHCMAAVASYPELSCTHDTTVRVSPGHNFAEWYGNGEFKMLEDNTMNPSDEKVYAFLDKVFTELAALFPGQYIHVGGDECYRGFWEKDPGCQALMAKEGMKNSMGLHGYFMRRMEKILQSKGKKLIGWSEILEGNLSKESVVMAWHGYEDGIAGAKANYPVVMAPTPYTYLDLAQGELTVEPDVAAYQRVPLTSCYYEPVPEGIDAKFILGGEGALWTEKVPTRRHAEYLTWPRGWALAEVYWSQKEVRNWNNFLIRMETHMKRFNFAGVNYARCAFDARVKPKVDQDRLTVNISTEVPGLDIYYTIDETTPDTYAQRYAGTLEIPQGNVTLKVVTYRDGQPVGKLIALSRAELIKRAKEN